MFVVFGLVVSACQSGPPAAVKPPEKAWRVIERTGSAHVLAANNQSSFGVRPGQTIQNGQILTTGENAFLIIASEGIQLTLGENTQLTLPTSDHAPVLDISQGWLRARLATSADRMTQIKAPDIAIDASATVLTLATDSKTFDLSIEDGSVTVMTMKGDRRASLAAGAAAKIDRTIGETLLVRSSPEQTFAEVTPILSSVDDRQSEQSVSVPMESADLEFMKASNIDNAEDVQATRQQIWMPSAAKEASKQPVGSAPRIENVQMPITKSLIEGSTMAIRPASNRKVRRDKTQMMENPAVSDDDMVQAKTITPAFSNIVPDQEFPLSNLDQIRRTQSTDPAQAPFDRLTEGLLDGLR